MFGAGIVTAVVFGAGNVVTAVMFGADAVVAAALFGAGTVVAAVIFGAGAVVAAVMFGVGAVVAAVILLLVLLWLPQWITLPYVAACCCSLNRAEAGQDALFQASSKVGDLKAIRFQCFL